MVTDVTGAGGTAQGGTIDLLASNGGLIQATSTTASSSFSTDAQSGASAGRADATGGTIRSEEHTSELQSLMRISYAVFCLKKKKQKNTHTRQRIITHIKE